MALSDDVERDIRRIAKHGRAAMRPRREPGDFGKPIWLGFDDVDMAWFLRKHEKRQGRSLDKLRKQLREAYAAASANEPWYWPITKPQARALLREIGTG